jgi:hypothetical protein
MRKNKNILTVHKMHNAKLGIDRLYMKRKERGRDLLLIEATEVNNIAEYLNTKYKQDRIVDTVKCHAINQPNMN